MGLHPQAHSCGTYRHTPAEALPMVESVQLTRTQAMWRCGPAQILIASLKALKSPVIFQIKGHKSIACSSTEGHLAGHAAPGCKSCVLVLSKRVQTPITSTLRCWCLSCLFARAFGRLESALMRKREREEIGFHCTQSGCLACENDRCVFMSKPWKMVEQCGIHIMACIHRMSC